MQLTNENIKVFILDDKVCSVDQNSPFSSPNCQILKPKKNQNGAISAFRDKIIRIQQQSSVGRFKFGNEIANL